MFTTSPYTYYSSEGTQTLHTFFLSESASAIHSVGSLRVRFKLLKQSLGLDLKLSQKVFVLEEFRRTKKPLLHTFLFSPPDIILLENVGEDGET